MVPGLDVARRSEAMLIDIKLARTARQAGLRYVRDCDRGITRRRAGKGFVYLSVKDTVNVNEFCARSPAASSPPSTSALGPERWR
jgi:hypothetical protein